MNFTSTFCAQKIETDTSKNVILYTTHLKSILKSIGETKLSYFYEATFPLQLISKESGLIEATVK